MKSISKYIPQFRLVLILLLTTTAGVGLVLTWQDEVAGSAVTFIQEVPQADSALSQVAYITGAVSQPGVYEINAETSIGDLVQRAGGFTEDADASYLTSELNLTKLVENREHIQIPSVYGKTDMQVVSEASSGPSTSGKININTADQAALESLPGVGPALAANIIAARPFKAIIDLQYVKGIGDAKYKQLEPLVSL